MTKIALRLPVDAHYRALCPLRLTGYPFHYKLEIVIHQGISVSVCCKGIPERWVLETLQEPTQIVEGYGGRNVAHRKYVVKGKEFLLRVVFEEMKDSYFVIIGYLTSQIDRYWKENIDEDSL